MPKLTLTLDINPTELYAQRLLLAYLERYDIDDSPIGGLLELTDAIADELSENGNDKALLNGSSSEDARGERLLEDLRHSLLQSRLARPPATKRLQPYVVKLIEAVNCGIIDFPCDAEDPDHAREQAKNAYPGCTIKHILQYVLSND